MTTINVGDNYYDQQISKTYITSRNFNGTLSTTSASNELFPCDNLDKYYFDTLLYLHLFSSLYIALEAFQKTINYDVIKFTNAIKVLNIDINNSAQTFSDVFKIIQLNGNGTDASPYISVTFTFYLDNFKKSVIQTDSITTPTGYTSISSINLDQSIVTKMMPITYGLNSFNEVSGYTNIEAAGYTTYSTNGYSNIITYNSNVKSFTLSSITSGTEKTILETAKTTTYNDESRKQKLYSVIYNILNQDATNIMGYLLFNKLYYNIILCNLSIQADIRREYVNKQFTSYTSKQLYGVVGGNIWTISDTGKNTNIDIDNLGKDKINIAAVNSGINNAKTIITKLIDNHFPSISSDTNQQPIFDPTTQSSRYFLVSKSNYANKIGLYNDISDRYLTSQDLLNNIIATYNQYIKDFSKMKNYANIVILILIAVSIFIIALSIFPIVNANTKQAIYIIVLIALIVMTYLFYDNFKYINIIETFAASTANVVSNTDGYTCAVNTLYTSSNSWARFNNNQFYSVLIQSINDYTTEQTKLLNKIRSNIYIAGARTFNQNTDNLLIDIQRDKLSKIAAFNTKKTNLLNMIEVMKKQLSYTFNLILLFCLFLIILLIALLIYSSIPDAFPFIIGITILLIIIFLTYFIVAIVQPTRMKATNNYWGNLKPSEKTLNSL